MWYFTWLLGISLAMAAGIINILWLETHYAFGQRSEEATRASFESAYNRAQRALPKQ